MKPKLICFDFDDTLTTENSWYTLNIALGITPEEDYALYQAYKAGTLPYLDWTERISELYRTRGRANKTTIEQVLHSITLKPDAQQVIATLRERGYHVAIISGSFLSGVTYHAHQLGISYVSAGTNIEYDADDRFIKLTSEGDESNAKVRHLVKLCEEIGIKLTECACVGDGANDIGLFRATGQGICFSDAREDVITEAATTIESLSDLLDIFTSPHKREGE